MVNIILNYYNFDGLWAKPHIEKYVAGKKPLIVPLAFRHSQVFDEKSWQGLYGRGGEKYGSVLRPFLNYGYKEDEIVWLDFYAGREMAAKQINDADLLFFTGGLPEKITERLNTLGLSDSVKNFKGTVMGASAGAMFQLKRYHVTPDEDYSEYKISDGLGLLGGLDIEVHYEATALQNECARRAALELKLPVYAMFHEGGLVAADGRISLLGSVKEINSVS